MGITMLEVAGQFDRMSKIFSRPFDPKADKGTLREYQEALARAGLNEARLKEAVEVVIAEDRYFPTPSRLIEAYREAEASKPRDGLDASEAAYRRWLARDMGVTPCPVCGMEAKWAPRLYADCDPQRHIEANIPAVNLAPEDVAVHNRAWHHRHARSVIATIGPGEARVRADSVARTLGERD